jgi:proline iminopeptidase
MIVTINGNDLNVEVLGPEGAPVLIAHHGGGGIGSLAEPKAAAAGSGRQPAAPRRLRS